MITIAANATIIAAYAEVKAQSTAKDDGGGSRASTPKGFKCSRGVRRASTSPRASSRFPPG